MTKAAKDTSPDKEPDAPLAAEADASPSNEAASTPGDNDVSIREQLSALVSDAQLLAKAELEYYRARLSFTAAEARGILVLLGLGAALVLAAIIGAIVGLLLILSPLITPIGATIIVVGSALAFAAILIWRGSKRMKNLSFSGEDEE